MIRMKERIVAIFLVVVILLGSVAPVVTALPGDEQQTESNHIDTSDIPSDVTTNSDSPGEIQSDSSPADLGSTVAMKLETADSGDKIPVIVVFDRRPSDEFEFQSMGGSEARKQLKQLASSQQARAKDYLTRAQERNRAGKAKTLWSTNSLAVKATPETIKELRKFRNVESIVYDKKVEQLDGSLSPFGEILDQYGNTTEPAGFESSTSGDRAWGVEYIDADHVQQRGITGEGVNVSVVDTGIDDSHPALEGSVTEWKDFTADNYSEPDDFDGHGTHVAGTIAGRPSGSKAVGVAPGADLFGAKVFSETESSRISTIVSAFEWSAKKDADVISASIGVPPIYELYDGTESTGGDAVGSSTVPVHTNANDSVNFSATAYKPAYVMVVVEPVSVDGEPIESSSRRAAVMKNLTVSLQDPSGDTPLTPVSAGWAFEDGSVPDEIVYRKYKPQSGSAITTDGDWSLEVQSESGQNVSYRFAAAPVYPTNGSDELSESIDTISASHDTVSVIAAGNYGFEFGNRTLSSPGTSQEAITVGATDYKVNDVAPFSSRGPVGYGDEQRPGVDVIAPGTNIVSSVPVDQTPDGYEPYASYTGTSMATPHVSGVAALVLDAAPSKTPSETKSLVTSSAQDIPVGANAAGDGVVDAWRAVEAANASALEANASPEAGRHTLFAGISDTADDQVFVDVEPHQDPEGDSGSAPDIRATSRFVTDNFEVATWDKASKNATFRLFLDTDQNDTTGDPDTSGAEYVIVINRTFDGASYDLTVDERAYEASTGEYTPTDSLDTFPGDANGLFIQLYNLEFADRPNNKPFDWHVTSAPLGGESGDRFPDTGQATHGDYTVQINGTAVAWNATAGAPDSGTPVTFNVYNNSGSEVATSTVQAGERGRANASFDVTVTSAYQDLTLEATDSYSNEIRQEYYVSGACIAPCLVSDSSGIEYTADERTYRVSQNKTISLNIPVYNESSGELNGYTGEASLRLLNYDADETLIINNISVDDGVVRTTIDLSETRLDAEPGYVDISLALTGDYNQASATTDAGNIRITQGAEISLAPRTTVVEPESPATLSFQAASPADGKPENVSTDYTVQWVTDRNVARLYSELPEDTVAALQSRKTSPSSESTSLDPHHRHELAEALQNISANSVSVKQSTGVATPTARGVGTFNVTPPEDTRFGFVTARDNGSSVIDSTALVFVTDRVNEYTDQPSAPSETTDRELNIDARWDETYYPSNDTLLPSENISIFVAVEDSESNLVGGVEVVLYTTTGETLTVTTNASEPVEVTIPAPDKDWINTSYRDRQQQILGVAKGLRTADGEPVSTTEYMYASAFKSDDENDIYASPELTYTGSGELEATLSYYNETSNDPVAGDRTLFILKERSTFGYGIERDIMVGYVDPDDQQEISLNITDPDPAGPGEPRQYRVGTRTAGMDENTLYIDDVRLNGLRATVDIPDTLTDESSTPVTISVVDRSGEPIQNAVVRWSYIIYTPENRTYDANVPPSLPGGTAIGTTDENGTITVDVSPDIAESLSSGYLSYTVGVATENYSTTEAASGFTEVTQTNAVISGSFVDSSGTELANDTVAVFGSGQGAVTRTDASGAFAATVSGNNDYDVQYYQRASDGTYFPRDGVADLYAADRVTVGSSNVSVGEKTVPDASVLDVRVVDESGDPVRNAPVTITHLANNATANWQTQTDTDGMVNITPDEATGIEITGDVRLTIRDPDTNDRFPDQTVVKNITVTSDQTVEVTLTDSTATVSGTVDEADGSPAANDTIIFYPTGSDEANFEFTRTNASGHYSVTLPEDREYVPVYVQVNGSSFSSEDFARDGSADIYTFDQRVNTTTDTTLSPVQIPNGSVLNITVVDADGDPVSNASVKVTSITNGSSGSVFGLTNPDGLFDLPWTYSQLNDGAGTDTIPPGIEVAGTVNVTVRPPTNSSRFQDTQVETQLSVTDDTTVTLALEERPSISGRLEYPNGTSAANDTVANFGGESDTNVSESVITDENGTFTMPTVAATAVDVQYYQGDGMEPPRDGIVDIYALKQVNTTDGAVDIGTVTVPNGSVLNVTVVDENGTPVSNADVDIRAINGDADAELENIDTNQNGRLQFKNVTPGIEVNGSVEVTVTPPADSPRFADKNYTRTLTVTNETEITVPIDEINKTETKVGIEPTTSKLAKNQTATYDIIVETTEGGVGAFETTLNVSNATVVNITNGTVEGDAGFSNVSVSANGSQIYLDGALMDTNDTGSVVIATVTVRGNTRGETTLNLSVGALGNESGTPYVVTGVTNATVNVTGVGPLRSSYGPPTDPDGDGIYEDVNGDGTFDIVDIQALYTTRDSDTVQANQALFDVNGDGSVDIVDVQALYNEYQEAR